MSKTFQDIIELKVWDKQEKKFADIEILFLNSGSSEWINNFVILRYTGIKDMFGTKLFEGDIVKDADQTYIIRYGEFDDPNNTKLSYIGFYFEHIDRINMSDFDGGFSSFDSPVIEKIGNIFENPDKANL